MSDPQTLDVRWLEPPEPFERITAALDALPAGGRLRVLIHREPQPLYRWLEREGFRHRSRYAEEGYFEIIIDK
jgi:uncharacterized protein (DUF2249 family)